jgi:FkbM family methyltransferase
MGRLAFLVDTVNTARWILHAHKPPLRGEVLRGYLKLRFQHTRLRRFLKAESKKQKLAGFTVECIHPALLEYMFEEIFVRRDYGFGADTASPHIIDCGSNIGLSVLFFKKLYPEATVVAFEPDPQAFAVLRANIENNHLTAVEAHNKAVLDAPGTTEFYVDAEVPGSLCMSTRTGRHGTRACTVECVALSDYVNGTVDFLKLDIEGAEHVVLEELARKGKLRNIQKMVVEYHHHIDPEEDNLSKILKLLEDHGFGYQLACGQSRPFVGHLFADILLYGYRK